MKEPDFEAIYERYHQALYRFCLSIVGNAEDARDALQNTMVKALRSLPGEEREIQLKPWLYRVAHNESIELLRRRRDQVELDTELAASTGGPAEEAALRERLRILVTDLRELPERQRAALVMRELAGLEFAEIGNALETSAGVARQTIYEARLNLGQLQAGREMDCEKVRWEISGEDRRTVRRRDIQAHLRECAECRAFQDSIAERRHDLAALTPLPAVASAGLLHAVLAGGQSGGSSLAGAIGAGKVAGTSVAAKSVATVAIVAAIAVPAADRGGLVDVGLFHSGASHSQGTSQPASKSGAAPGSSAAAGGKQGSSNASSVTKIAPRSNAAAGDSPDTDRQNATTGGSSPADTAPPSTAAEGKTQELPAASDHGQETAASHGGGREAAGAHAKGHTHANGHSHAHAKPAPQKPTHPTPPAGAEHQGDPPAHPPAGQPPDMSPDNAHEQPLQPSQPPVNEGPPDEPGAQQRSKEAR